jgi:hypothetical protein
MAEIQTGTLPYAGEAGIYMKFEFSDEKREDLGEIGRILRAVDRRRRFCPERGQSAWSGNE